MRESDLLEQIDQWLELRGWVVYKFSARHSLPGQLAGWPDRVAFRQGTVLLIEAKGEGGQLREKQLEFAAKIRPELGPHLLYCVARTFEDVQYWA